MKTILPKLKSKLLIYIKGLGMGSADIIPGVSGGTVAFITGVYEDLLQSLRSLTPANFKKIFTEGVNVFWKKINGNFLTALVLGVGTGVFTLAKLMLYLLEHHPIPVWSFFFGLILISTFSVLRTVRKVSAVVFIVFAAGMGSALLITEAASIQTPDDLWFIFLSGAIAICAMILPGISGSFILLLLGKYEYILNALTELKAGILAVFAGGAIVGLLSFSHFLSWLLKRFHDATIALLAGFMFGSLNKVWPWKVMKDMTTGKITVWNLNNSRHLVEEKLTPADYALQTDTSCQIYPALGMALFAIAFYLCMELIARKTRLKTENKPSK
ncbi:MAG: DUF368 domain-containing protein [Bacteroidales bacterium]|jgi:putative membrane protein|nr:DUF368 domain-containing protein [Bacteroidales bacterium]